MSTSDVIAAASDPTFYARVAFIALKVAQQVAAEDPATPDHALRASYSGRIFTGEDMATLIAMHVAAAHPAIAAALETGGGDAVADLDIEIVLGSIWTARARAFAGVAP